jgi:hypothetical protein
MNQPNQARSLFARCNATRTLQALVAVAALGTFMPLHAEPPAASQPGTTAAQDDPMQAARQLHGEYVELQNRLGMIQEKAVQAHPELQKQQQALEDLMMAKMTSSSGTSAKDELVAIDQLEQKLRNKDTPESERKTLMGEFQKRAKVFREAQLQALQDPEVQKAQTALMDATLAAMKQQDPQTEKLVEQLQQKQQQMKQMMESAGHMPR